jgi:class 3 adenylate cyclase
MSGEDENDPSVAVIISESATDSSGRDAIAIIRSLLAEAWAPRDAAGGLTAWHDQVFGRDDDDVDLDVVARRIRRPEITTFERELAALRAEVEEKAAALLDERLSVTKRDERINDLEQVLSELVEKQKIGYLLSHVGESGQKRLLEATEIKDHFVNGVTELTYVISVDIRRSTELMLRAREPRQFATFITNIGDILRRIVLANDGVFDKFTGDGILAVFPEFYCGEAAGSLAAKTALECHEAFEECYRNNRGTFDSVLRDVGLGIGIDFGPVHMVQVGGDFTVVGRPVVYACRMAGAPAGNTFVNQAAYEQLRAKCVDLYDFEETEIDIKHEGFTVAYALRRRAGTKAVYAS